MRADKWTGIRDGSKMPSPCLQVSFAQMILGQTLSPDEMVGDEDCLYLNVFTPKVSYDLLKGIDLMCKLFIVHSSSLVCILVMFIYLVAY